MCLVKANYVAPVAIGYKFYSKNDDGTYSPIYGNSRLKFDNGWKLAAADEMGGTTIGARDAGRYPIGFHVLPTKTDVFRFLYADPRNQHDTMHRSLFDLREDVVLLEVEYQGVLATGVDYTCMDVADVGTQCVVASRLRIHNEIPHTEFKKFFRNVNRVLK